ncbi:MAG: YqgE/AlgH family protein [Paracoccaceae bacterium]|nr:YqgE/AlgH family protein [Paracoccaceae bacterium]
MTDEPETPGADHVQDDEGKAEFLSGQILIAMPGMQDPRFHRSVVYLCAHSQEGAMGLIVNKRADDLRLKDLFEKLEIPVAKTFGKAPVHYGGPVETGRGFVLHSSDYFVDEATMQVDDETSMTATLEILHAMATDQGPDQAIVALGYAGWAPGQLEAELQGNGWLACPSDEDLLFDDDADGKWDKALAKIGVHPAMLSSQGGTA